MLINELPSFEVSLLNPLMDLIDEYFKLDEVQKFLEKYRVPFKEVNSVDELTVKCQRVGLWFISLKNINNTGIFGSIVVTGSNVSLTLKSSKHLKNKDGKVKHFKDYKILKYIEYLESFLEPFKPSNIADFASPLRSFDEGLEFKFSGDFNSITITGKNSITGKYDYFWSYTMNGYRSRFVLRETKYG